MKTSFSPHLQLLTASLLWPLSFILIKGELTGIPSTQMAFIRTLLATTVFFILILIERTQSKSTLSVSVCSKLSLLGFVQFGLMYIFYLKSFLFLGAHQVALLTLSTPLYVYFIGTVLEKRNLRLNILLVLLLNIACCLWALKLEGAWVTSWPGIAYIQLANFFFALGQSLVNTRMNLRRAITDHPQKSFFWQYLGAFLGLGFYSVFDQFVMGAAIQWKMNLEQTQWLYLIYLGLVPTALAFFLWNRAATKVQLPILGLFNDLKIPLTLLLSALMLQESVAWERAVTCLIAFQFSFRLLLKGDTLFPNVKK